MPILLLVMLSSLSLARAEEPAPQPITEFQVDRVEGSTLHFKIPESQKKLPPLKTAIFEIEPLGVIQNNADPYLILAGLPCETCKNNKSVFMIRADDGSSRHGTALTIHYPGVVKDREKGAVLHRSRAFFGKCLPSKNEGLFIFQEEKVDRRRFLQHSVFVAEIQGDKIKEELIASRRLPSINNALKLVKSKHCQEIKGTERPTIRFPD